MSEQNEIRKIQLVAREGVLTQILEEWDFPTENHRKVIELLHKETVDEMHKLGLSEYEGQDDGCWQQPPRGNWWEGTRDA